MSVPWCSEGVVRKIEKQTVTVEVTIQSACASCQVKGLCGNANMKHELIKAKTDHPEKLNIGDTIRITMKQSMGGKAVTIGYLLPLVVMIITLFITYSISHNELLSVILALVLTTVYYLFIWMFGKKIGRQFVFYVEKEDQI